MPILMLATTNAGKAAEFRALLAQYFDPALLHLITPRDWPVSLPIVEETGQTFAENARLKAQALSGATGVAALADDSGLCIDALGGLPGLHSARWAGPEASDADRTARLLRELADVPASLRTGRFVCAAAVAFPDGLVVEAEGVCEGIIADHPRGMDGFGYDPVFLPGAQTRTLAEMTTEEKNGISHRAQALARLAPRLSSLRIPLRDKKSGP
ncbi:MAG: RdgB/HAM1 family non-canonical purine NTP pyrophosphatase [Armatimonadota bacterium]|nr:RdgB/HAM1 family non-canonical purine NTP pyrophosphatase [Armatimonadota bacterium]